MLKYNGPYHVTDWATSQQLIILSIASLNVHSHNAKLHPVHTKFEILEQRIMPYDYENNITETHSTSRFSIDYRVRT